MLKQDNHLAAFLFYRLVYLLGRNKLEKALQVAISIDLPPRISTHRLFPPKNW